MNIGDLIFNVEEAMRLLNFNSALKMDWKDNPRFQKAGFYIPKLNTVVIREQDTLAQTVYTLCHEYTHYLQCTSGRLKTEDDKPDEIFFDGNWYKKDMPYYLRPWEQEAVAKEKYYFNIWLSSLDNDLLDEVIKEVENV